MFIIALIIGLVIGGLGIYFYLKPKLKTFIPDMADNLCRVLGIPVDNAGISATTLEGLGFVGREEGICVSCSVVLKNRSRAL